MRPSGSQISRQGKCPVRERARGGDLMVTFGCLASSSTFGSSAHGSPGGGSNGCLQPEMVDHDHRVIVRRHRLDALETASALEVHRQPVPCRRRQHPVEAGIRRVLRHAAGHHDADGHRGRRGLPVGDRLRHAGIGRIDRLD
jgi:hypothetical protein